MPRQPTKRRRLCTSQPLTFSPFARSLAQLASTYTMKQQSHDLKSQKETLYNLKANGFREDNTEEETTSESSEEEFEGVIQADFAFFDPKPGDFHGAKTLLQNYLDDMQWDLSGFVDIILEQTTVGTVVKLEDDEDDGVFSLVTSLNLGRYEDFKCIMELKEYLLKACHGNNVMSDLRLLLTDHAHKVGLLVSQRVMNLPPLLLPPLYDALFDEVSWATEDEPTEELRHSFRFEFYLLISKIYMHKRLDPKGGLKGDNKDIIYTKPEDEIFLKLSSWSFTFPLHRQVATHELRNYQTVGLVMAVKADKVSTFRQELKSLIEEC